MIPLGQLAQISLVQGPPSIRTENALLSESRVSQCTGLCPSLHRRVLPELRNSLHPSTLELRNQPRCLPLISSVRRGSFYLDVPVPMPSRIHGVFHAGYPLGYESG